MKNIVEQFRGYMLLFAMCLTPFFTACSSDNADAVVPEIVVAKSEFSFPNTGGTNDLSIKSNVQLEVSSSAPDWCKVVPVTAASTTVFKFSITVEANTSAKDRTSVITVKGGERIESVTVKQLAAVQPEAGMESDAMTLAAKIYAGWNLGNTLEAIGGETNWGNPKTTETLIRQVKALGFNAVRIPCAWDQYIEDQSTYKIKDSWLERVNEVVGYCVQNGMYAILNIHWDGGWLENNCTADKKEANNKKQQALWTQIANKLNHFNEYLLFAGCNEPNVENAAQMEVLKSYEQTFIDAVRATGGNNAVRNLIVQGPSTDIDKTSKLFGTMPTDVVANRLMVEVHYYNPWTFCGLEKDESWGKMAYFWGPYKVEGSDRNATFGEETELKTLFAKMKTQFVDRGIPVILGEYGAMVRTGLGTNQEAHNKSRGYYSEVVTRESKNNGLVPFFWDAGTFVMVNRTTGEVNDKYTFDGITKGAKEGQYPY